MTSRGISPPPTKRIKISRPHTSNLALPSSSPLPPPKNTLRIFSWNVNGIAPFLQNIITQYFAAPKHSFQESAHRREHPASLRDFLRRNHWPAVLFLQEVKISPHDEKTQTRVRTALMTRLPSEQEAAAAGPIYDAYFTLPTDRNNARGLGGTGKVYGVCSIVRSDLKKAFGIVPHVRTVDWDREGRVSIVELTSITSDFKLAVFNIYAVNGTDSPYRDPRTGTVVGTRHDRKLEFHRLLMEECIKTEKNGWHVVMAGDFNVAQARIDGHPNLRTFPHQHVLNRADFLRKFLGQGVLTTERKRGQDNRELSKDANEEGSKNEGPKVKALDDKYLNDNNAQPDEGNEESILCWQGIDVWRAMKPDIRRFTYFPRTREWGSSCDRVDYVLTSKKLWDTGRVSDAGILDNEAERGPSDHVPIWVDINLKNITPQEQGKAG